jgi:hypothetical protein
MKLSSRLQSKGHEAKLYGNKIIVNGASVGKRHFFQAWGRGIIPSVDFYQPPEKRESLAVDVLSAFVGEIPKGVNFDL